MSRGSPQSYGIPSVSVVGGPTVILHRPSIVAQYARSTPRLCVRGKFCSIDKGGFYARGVTYGTFSPLEDGSEYPIPEVVERDFAQMAVNGVNAVRTYTVPPRLLLDSARRHGLHVMVGLSVERYIGYRADNRKKSSPNFGALVRSAVRAFFAHSAVLCYTTPTEIPAPLVRCI